MNELENQNGAEQIGYDGEKGAKGAEQSQTYNGSATSEKKSSKGWLKWLIIAGIILAVFAIFAVPVYNKLTLKDEDVNAAWAQVQNQYQRRADLIPNFVETVKGYASHERGTLEGVIEARAKATSVKIDANDIANNPEAFTQFNNAQGELSSALSRLMLVVERYPELKANSNFTDLQNQLEGTENRIAVARKDYIAVVQEYNKMIRVFPTNIIAKLVGKGGAKPVFNAGEANQNAPKVSF
ncbi:LemA family protein [Campylobacter sp. JMF_01 NE2]|uniref:LemA family protein n=1 Tax=unclassified Campylobacter TaxID=2593542 RepID=UPI0022E9AC13|nr:MULTISPECIES: LemA family protein [unclassified Campylobacter]MDA3053671.1 LemA family protein [Campylobacter sp. JMF_03 NE3]MDA3067762.1 LemA family protein [Campylobacter sp. JMF_01 NE2]